MSSAVFPANPLRYILSVVVHLCRGYQSGGDAPAVSSCWQKKEKKKNVVLYSSVPFPYTVSGGTTCKKEYFLKWVN